jgi:probable rRNA maturation factor
MKLLLRSDGRQKGVPRAWLARLASLVLRRVKGASFERKCELSIVLTGDGEVRRLNRAYRNKDKTTDVLSFPLLEGKRPGPGPGGILVLGDVVISLPQTRRQAAQAGKGFKEELALLVVHGILHLLGYDHATRIQEKRMFGLQERILNGFLRKF